jgi:hypothetical protein
VPERPALLISRNANVAGGDEPDEAALVIEHRDAVAIGLGHDADRLLQVVVNGA